jgi:hypothetical protein
MTSQGSPYARFHRALRSGNLDQVRIAARELPQVGLDDALAVVLLISKQDGERYDRAATRWLPGSRSNAPPSSLRTCRSAWSRSQCCPTTRRWRSARSVSYASATVCGRLPRMSEGRKTEDPAAVSVGWHRDSDGVGERCWDGISWRDFRVATRDWRCLGWLAWPCCPVLVIAFVIGSLGVHIASALICLALAVLVVRSVRAALTVTPSGVTERGGWGLRERRYRIEEIADAFVGETPATRSKLGLRLIDGRSVSLGDGYPPSSVEACALRIRRRLAGRAAPSALRSGRPALRRSPSVGESALLG